MIVLIIVAALLVIMGILIIIGKGDKLIAGYNTTSKEEKAQYNIKRLRGIIGGLLIVLAPMTFILLGKRDDEGHVVIRSHYFRREHRCCYSCQYLGEE